MSHKHAQRFLSIVILTKYHQTDSQDEPSQKLSLLGDKDDKESTPGIVRGQVSEEGHSTQKSSKITIGIV